MVPVHELTEHSLVLTPYRGRKIWAIRASEIQHAADDFNPVLLTLKFLDDYKIQELIKPLTISWNCDTHVLVAFIIDTKTSFKIKLRECKYVHELQLVYNAVTGKPLIIQGKGIFSL